ncbi:Transmembrane protein [Phytophthora megakarya]|uniref:Transmembrane protein n=1 Tax=Phytophthora megakarya TaxID=4795 RepID=A0A225X3V7_9STRA|nr:Transmembrane protein [Phytophthora megakarya]
MVSPMAAGISPRSKGFAPMKTPDSGPDIEGGALRAGGPINVWSREYIGIIVQYAAVGMIYGTLPGTVYPFLFNYLNMESTQVVSATVLLNLPWSFKLFYGVITDCVPIMGYRRRPFMIIGWTVCFIMLLVMACMKAGDPYYPEYEYASMNVTTLSPDIVATFNTDARSTGSKFIVLMMIAAIGYVGADVAADAMMVEIAQREPEATRGYTQTTIYMVRTVFVTISSILTGFAFNGTHYGGDFDFSLSFPQLMIILTVLCLPVMPLTWFFIKEEKHEGMVFSKYLNELWALVQTRPVYQVIAYKFFSGIFENFTITSSSAMQAYWAGVTPLNEKILTIVGNGIFALTLYFTGKYGLHWNWRWMHATMIIAVTVMDSFVTLLTTWDVVRNQWFWLGVPVVENLPSGLSFVIGTYVIVELAEEGNEGAVYGLIGSVTNLATPFASTITKNVDSSFDVANADIASDTNHVRWEVTYILIIRYAMNLAGLLFLPLLPKQKAETNELKRNGGSSRILGFVTLAYFAFALVYSTMVNIMSIFPAMTSKCPSSAFAAPSATLSDELCRFLDSLEHNQATNTVVHMRTGRRQLETFVQQQNDGVATFEQVLEKESSQWEEHLKKAKENNDVRVQQRHVLPELLPGLQVVHDIKVGKPGRPDDAVYLKSQYAREWLPRGNCIAEWTTNDKIYFFPLVRGYRKFTGQEDDGELKKHTETEEEELSKFFTKPQTQSKWVISTTKENGEAGHLAVLKRSDGEFVFVLGSKNTHLMVQTVEDIERARETQVAAGGNDPFFSAAPIATAILRMLFALELEKRNLLCEFLWQTRTTASFEVLCPSHQHVQLLDYLTEDTPVFYGLSLMTLSSLEGAEICVNPVLLYEFMRALGMRTVTYDIVEFNDDTFEAALERSKRAYQHEGGVHLFLDEDAAVIGMQKHKSIWYVCLRAIREKAKTFCRTLNSKKPPKGRAKPMTPKEALKVGQESVLKRFRAIPGFLHISDEVSDAYATLGEYFLEYLFSEELFCGTAADKEQEAKCKQAAKDVADLFPVVWKRFLDHTGQSDDIGRE